MKKSENKNEINLHESGKILYGKDKTPPPIMLFFLSCQHMLICLSIGLALPVSVIKAAGLDPIQSGSYMAAALFGMGLTSIFQTIKGKFLGSGYQSMSATDSAAIAACVLAAEIGGIPLVLGMSLFSCILRFAFGFFASKLRKIFSPVVTGTLVFLVGTNLIPTSFKNFLCGGNTTGIAVAALTLLVMIVCTLFIKPLKPYSALIGIIFGYIISIATGFFGISELESLGETAFVGLPIYKNLAFSFDFSVILPFAIITVAAVVDNIGDFSACQAGAEPKGTKTDWKSIEKGIRGGALGNAMSVFLGGSLLSTATANIGVLRASGIVSRSVAYGASVILIVLSFFPKITGILSLIPSPVFGAVVMYSMCYIMSNGFSTLQTVEFDDRNIFTVFISLAAAISTFIPNLYSFLPESVSQIIITPMNMGLIMLVVTSLLGKIGSKKKYVFTTGVSENEITSINAELVSIGAKWSIDRILLKKLQISIDGICEGIYEQNKEAKVHFEIIYDGLQIKLKMKTGDISTDSESRDGKTSLSVAMMILNSVFDNVKISSNDNMFCLSVNADLQ